VPLAIVALQVAAALAVGTELEAKRPGPQSRSAGLAPEPLDQAAADGESAFKPVAFTGRERSALLNPKALR
jgi:hypothetical protein